MAAPRVRHAAALGAAAVTAGFGTCGLAPALAANAAEELAILTLGMETFLAIAALAGAALSPLPVRARLGLGPGRLPPWLLAVAVAGALGLSHALDALLTLSGWRDDSVLEEVAELLAGARGTTLALALLALGVAPGIAEELLCRGLLQRGLAPRVGPPLAVALAALVFGALHLEWVQGGAAALLGVYLGTVAHLAGSIRAAIACHTANNLAAVLLAAGAVDPGTSAPTQALAGLAVAGAAVWLLWRAAGTHSVAVAPREPPPPV